MEKVYFERRGEWIHEVGWPSVHELLRDKRTALTNLLQPHLASQSSARPDTAP